MEIREILSKCDHTLLAPQATFEEIRQVCDEGIRYGTASVCIPPCFVKEAKSYVGDRLPICTVIGFPVPIPRRSNALKRQRLYGTGRTKWIW